MLPERSKTLRRLIFGSLFLVGSFSAVAQESGKADSLRKQLGISATDEAAWNTWIQNLYEIGVVVKGDSVFISEEARRVANDTTYRKFIYREQYSWDEAQFLMQRMQFKIGFWHMINLYDADSVNRPIVHEYVVNMDQVLQMDKVLIAVFYTYGLLDSKVGYIKNGRPTITRPDIVERKLAVTNTIVQYVLAERLKRQKPGK